MKLIEEILDVGIRNIFIKKEKKKYLHNKNKTKK